MDRVAGWYKRKAQTINVILAVLLTIAVNGDSILIVQSLSNNSALREALVAQAQQWPRNIRRPRRRISRTPRRARPG